ncbi:hypothetical protein L211DRAFT_846383 [Terfezia boudieri ATCC MYA-4762]|uniref:C2H2-type domain-containing protein n=1 Tax=Terfezia boudieri ATCC MYA-4762 TaxID=1051890 RepID=A0A3N4MEZ0_9PEZI|nr:hypothetical protein L211DRAFT_846383 [Terfezia boudieri ATCC MYA-4762]
MAHSQSPERFRNERSRDRAPPLRESEYGRLNSEGGDVWYGRRRSRSRSPSQFGRRRPPRSRSPPPDRNIDRYVPDPNRRDDRLPRDRDLYASVGSGFHQPRPGTIDRYVPNGSPAFTCQAALLDPHKLDHQVTFAYFSDWINQQPPSPASHRSPGGTAPTPLTKDEVKVKYDAYREEFNTRMAKVFVLQHMNEEWFKEKYLPGEREIVRRKIVAFRQSRYDGFVELLEEGKLDGIDREGVVIPHTNGKPDENKDVDNDDNGVIAGPGGQLIDETIYKPTLLIKTISPTVSRVQLEELASTIPDFHFISLSDPNPLKKFHRIAFIILKPDAPPVDGDTVELLNEKKIHSDTYGDFTCHVGIHTANKELKKKVLNEGMSTPENLRKEVGYLERIINKFEDEMNKLKEPTQLAGNGGEDDQMKDEFEDFEGHNEERRFGAWEKIKERVEIWGGRLREGRKEEEEEGEDSEEEKEDLEMIKKTIDLGVEYLRRVYNFCIYCVAEADSIHELTRKCPGGHTRRPTPTSDDYTPDTRTTNWIRVWYEKLDCFLSPATQDLKKLGGKPVQEAIDEELEKHVKMEDEGKYRCKVQNCTKLFKAENFWRKHIEKRHSDWLEKIELEASLVNAYATDPCRVHPPKVDYNGNTQQGNGGQFGDRRQFPVVSGGAGFIGGGAGLPPLPSAGMSFPCYPAGPLPFVPGPGGIPQDPRRLPIPPGALGAGIGPVRGHNRRDQPLGNLAPPGANSYRSAPYGDRRRRSPPRGGLPRDPDRDGRRLGDRDRDSGRGGPGGRPLPLRGGPPPPVLGEPEAAIQGRSLKSYNDLDATRDGKVEELDY